MQLFLLVFGLQTAQAQEAVITVGSDATGSAGTVAYSIGQIVYTTNTGINGIVAQGVQQPFEIQTVLGADNFNINLQLAVYPNPITATSSTDLTAKVQIQILEDWTNGEITLFDMVGRPVYAGKIANTDGTSILEVSGLANGIYILQIKADGGKSFVGKVIVNK